MPLQEVTAERFAQLFHEYQQALASDDNKFSTNRTRAAWDDMPSSEKDLMVAAAHLALLDVELLSGENETRKYFAKPGEAEWGC
jgi:hypothetical protein